MARITIGRVLSSGTDSVTVVQGGTIPWPVQEAAGLVPEAYDYILLAYNDGNVTSVAYKIGGAGGTTVATLTLTYTSNGDVESVTRT